MSSPKRPVLIDAIPDTVLVPAGFAAGTSGVVTFLFGLAPKMLENLDVLPGHAAAAIHLGPIAAYGALVGGLLGVGEALAIQAHHSAEEEHHVRAMFLRLGAIAVCTATGVLAAGLPSGGNPIAMAAGAVIGAQIGIVEIVGTELAFATSQPASVPVNP